jgi:hypothetical protein
MHVLDVYWIVRPAVYAGQADPYGLGGMGWVMDLAAPFGVLALGAGVLARRVAAGPLIPLGDPRLDESLRHRNYV